MGAGEGDRAGRGGQGLRCRLGFGVQVLGLREFRFGDRDGDGPVGLGGHRVEGGVLLVAGDPVGPPEAIPGLLAEACATAETRGLRIGVVGASDAFADLAASAGLRSLYIGDEAVVETAGFTLEGRKIKKVRQAVMHAIDRPTIGRLNRSPTTAKYSHPSAVGR